MVYINGYTLFYDCDAYVKGFKGQILTFQESRKKCKKIGHNFIDFKSIYFVQRSRSLLYQAEPYATI
jgi:hypothetical protein